MNITLYMIPNMTRFVKTIEKCAGHVFLQLNDQSCLNMRNEEDRKYFTENSRVPSGGFHLLIEEKKDIEMLIQSLF